MIVMTIAKRSRRKKKRNYDVKIINNSSSTVTQIPAIVVLGGTSKLRKSVLKAAVWMIYDQVGDRVAPNIELEITLVDGLVQNEAVYGDCFAADCMRSIRPRYFEIRIDDMLELPTLLETLAHEVVHLRQYAKDQLYEYRNGDSRYAGKRYPKDCEDVPWEEEASALEQHIYQKYSSQL